MGRIDVYPDGAVAGGNLPLNPGYVVLEDEFWNSATADDEIGALGWTQVNPSMGSSTYEPSITDHPGIHRVSASNTTNNIYGIANQAASGDGFIMPPQVDRIIWIVAPNSANANTQFRMGLCTNPSVANTGTDAVYFDYDNASHANWRSISRGASTNTTNNSDVVVTADVWYRLEIRRSSSGDWEFWINNVLKFTHTANKPTTTTPLNPFAVVQTTTTASKQLNIDYFGFTSVTLGNRYS